METIPIYKREEKAPQKPKEPTLLERCKYFKGEDECPYKDASSAEACYWDIERIAVREASNASSVMLTEAGEDLTRVDLPADLTDAIPAPVLRVAFVVFGNQCSAPYWSPEFATEFSAFLKAYGSNLV